LQDVQHSGYVSELRKVLFQNITRGAKWVF
jgi:hypothetical protein